MTTKRLTEQALLLVIGNPGPNGLMHNYLPRVVRLERCCLRSSADTIIPLLLRRFQRLVLNLMVALPMPKLKPTTVLSRPPLLLPRLKLDLVSPVAVNPVLLISRFPKSAVIIGLD